MLFKGDKMKLEPEYIEKLAKIITDNGLTEISMEDGEQAITIRKDIPGVIVPQASAIQAAPVNASTPSDSMELKNEAEENSAQQNGKAITSPMVGTFYMAPSPDAPPFVEIGSEVKVGDIVCIIEAMKLMNEIKSEEAGKVVKICVKNGDPVEFGQVLMYVE